MQDGKLRIVSWNCFMALYKKCDDIQKFDADIYVIQECGNPAKSASSKYKKFAKNYIWIGEDKNKGLGIFANEDIELKLIEDNNRLAEDYLCVKNEKEFSIGKFAEEGKKIEEIPKEEYIQYRHFIPVEVNGKFNLLAIWAMPEYVEMIHDYYNANKNLFNEKLVMCGDFNSSVYFDEQGEHKGKNFSMLLSKLRNKHNLVPAYHSLNEKEIHGKESKATYFYKKKLNSRFHIDHVFTAPNVVESLKIVDNVKWIKLSDHLPLVFEIDMKMFE